MRSRQHVNPLGLGFERFRGAQPKIRPGWPIEVEIGCADAQFLFERARADRDGNYVGIEIRDHLVAEVNERATAQKLPVQAIFCNANHHLDAVFPSASVDRVYLNFPDPWFKRRHHKRRMVDASLVGKICEVLAPGGSVFFQSDVWEIALEALEVFETKAPTLANRGGEWAFWKCGNPFGARSWREEHCEEEELPIWRLYYDRVSDGPALVR